MFYNAEISSSEKIVTSTSISTLRWLEGIDVLQNSTYALIAITDYSRPEWKTTGKKLVQHWVFIVLHRSKPIEIQQSMQLIC